jgi:glycosyltransferase 2 family protein
VDKLARTITGLGHYLRRPAIAAKLLLTSVVLLLGFSVTFIILAHGMQIQVSAPHVFLFMPLIFFVSALPIFYQGWGGREAIVIATIGSTGQVTSAEAIALSVAFGVVAFLASLPGAVLWIARPSMRKVIHTAIEQASTA